MDVPLRRGDKVDIRFTIRNLFRDAGKRTACSNNLYFPGRAKAG